MDTYTYQPVFETTQTTRERERDQKNRYVMGEHEWRIITCGHTRIQEDAKLSFCGAQPTLPGNIRFVIKNVVRDVHAVLVAPSPGQLYNYV